MNSPAKQKHLRTSEELMFSQVIRIIGKSLHWITLISLLIAVLMFAILRYLVPPRFESTVTLYVYNRADGDQPPLIINDNDLLAAERLAETYQIVLQSNAVQDAVIEELHRTTAHDPITRKELDRISKISVIGSTQLISIDVETLSRQLSYDIARSYAHVIPNQVVRLIKAGGVEVIDNAEIATEQSSPHVFMGTIYSFIVTFIVATIFFVWRTLADNRLYFEDDIEMIFDQVVVGSLPTIDANGNNITKRKSKKKRNSHRDLKVVSTNRLLKDDTPFAIKEAYVKLRTNLMFSLNADRTDSCSSFVITSANLGEGKSLTAANLAISFALLGKTTLLVDCDLRRPVQHQLWGIKPSAGISDMLAMHADRKFYKAKDLPLSVVCAGTIPPNPSELLASSAMQNFLEYVNDRFDYIILDTPPVNTVADAQILSSMVDGVLLVVASGETTSTELEDAIVSLEQVESNLCGVILNKVNQKSGQYKYKYGYKYSYEHPYSPRRNDGLR